MPPKRVDYLASFVQELSAREDDEISSQDLARCYGLDTPAHQYMPGLRDGPSPPKKRKLINAAACEAASCSTRARCLNWLGQAKWEDREQAVRDLQKRAGLGSDPHLEARDVTRPVGLKNLGATCFMNSFLQVWFQHIRLRQGVFACKVDENDAHGAAIYQLQVIFAALQEGLLSVYNPKPLVTALKIDQTEQQDAQEFAKLFMTLLDNAFAAQPNLEVRHLIKNLVRSFFLISARGTLSQVQFEGKLVYHTTCSACKAEVEREDGFTELTLTLKPNCNLADCIDRLLADEHFEGSNQYFCGKCASMQDAVRSTSIVRLPPVLHFSLMRFVYDLKVGDKKKTIHNITVPHVIDMSKCLRGSNRSETYDLCGILLHRGKSAHHGHYVAQVYDTSLQSWFLFDDENVQPLDEADRAQAESDAKTGVRETAKPKKRTFSVADAHDEDPIENVPSSIAQAIFGPAKMDTDVVSEVERARRTSMPIERTSRKPIKTSDAYMLIYTRRDEDSTSAMESTRYLSPSVQQALDDMTSDLEKRCHEFDVRNQDIVRDYEEIRAQKEVVWRVWTAMEQDDEAFFVDKDALSAWVVNGLALPPKQVIDLDGDIATPAGAHNASQSESNGVVSGGRRIDGGQKCSTNGNIPSDDPPPYASSPPSQHLLSASAYPQSFANGTRATEEMEPSIIAETTIADMPDTAAMGAHKRSVDALAPLDNITSNTATIHKSAEPSAYTLDSTAMLCAHGKVSPKRAACVKVISQLGVMALRDLHVDLKPLINSVEGLCRLCVENAVRQDRYALKHKDDVKRYKAALKADSKNSTNVWISEKWMQDWLRDKPGIHVSEGGQDIAPDAPAFRSDVICSHGALAAARGKRRAVAEKAMDVIRGLFPSSTFPFDDTVQPCPECDPYGSADDQLWEKARTERSTLADLYKGDRIDNTTVPLCSDRRYTVVSRAWLKTWRSWAKKPTERDCPGPMDHSEYICEHGLLLRDFSLDEDCYDVVFCLPAEYQQLCDAYTDVTDQPISVDVDLSFARLAVERQVCQECREQRRLDYDQAEVTIRWLTDDDFDRNGDRIWRAADQFFGASDSKPKQASIQSFYGKGGTSAGGRGLRSGTATTRESRPRDDRLSLDRGDTLKDIKRAIARDLKVPTIYQRLFFKGRELEDPLETVITIGMGPGDVIELYKLEMGDDKIDIGILTNGTIRASSSDRRKGIKAPERGFAGTGLHGFDIVPGRAVSQEVASEPEMLAATSDVASLANEVSPSEVSKGVDEQPCSRCTFLNPSDAERCSMCETAFHIEEH